MVVMDGKNGLRHAGEARIGHTINHNTQDMMADGSNVTGVLSKVD
jgi:hypothetical protein